MKAPSFKLTALVSAILVTSMTDQCWSQSFQNLDFEDGDPSSAVWNLTSECYWLSTAYGLPNWHTYYEHSEQSSIVYNSVWLDGDSVGLYDATAVAKPGGYQFGAQRPLDGDYSAYLHAEYGGPIIGHYDATIGQTGLIPAGAKSVQFISSPDAVFNYQPGLPSGMWTFSVQLNGISEPCYRLSQTSQYAVWGADVSGAAGTLTDLRITLTTGLVPLPRPGPPDTDGVIIGIDDISFSPNVVPEPTVLGLFMGAGAAMMISRRIRSGSAPRAAHPKT